MRPKSLVAAAAAALTTACGAPDPWVAEGNLAAASVDMGGSGVIGRHGAYDAFECVAESPPLEVVQQGRLGTARVDVTTEIYEDPLAELAEEDPSIELGPCDGAEYELNAVIYDAAEGASGIDTVVYREFGEGGAPDRIHTVSIRVR